MPLSLTEINGARIFECAPDGPPLRCDRDAIELMSEALGHSANWIAIPVSRFGDGFFDLKTQIAGEIIQKFVTYGVRIAIVGDISAKMKESASLRAFVAECNRDSRVWFLPSRDELCKRLAAK